MRGRDRECHVAFQTAECLYRQQCVPEQRRINVKVGDSG
jgi:hypothetical protein